MQHSRTCLLENCQNPYYAKHLCAAHYKKWERLKKKASRNTQEAHVSGETVCQMAMCSLPIAEQGLCTAHGQQYAALCRQLPRMDESASRLYLQLISEEDEKMRHEQQYLQTGESQCVIPFCSEEVKFRGLCKSHYFNYRAHVRKQTVKDVSSYIRLVETQRSADHSPNTSEQLSNDRHSQSTECVLSFCDSPVFSKTLCNKHYHNYRYHFKQQAVTELTEYVEYKQRQHVAKSLRPPHCRVCGCTNPLSVGGLCNKHHVNYLYHRSRERVWNEEEYLVFKETTHKIDFCKLE